jgi:NADP-dependent 3-hydroxy acid dehydrogenase YdfG
MEPALAGRTAVVTGASRGIGLACVRALVNAGARVAMLARTAVDLQRAAEALGSRAIVVPCDLGRPDAVAAAVRVVRERLAPSPDILVNNAGIFGLAPLEETSAEQFALSLAVNLVAPFLLSRALVPGMKARGSGHVLTIGSIADRVAYADNTAYAASKFGLRGLHEAMRAELAGSGVRVTLVSPGPVDTAIWDPIDPDARPGFTRRAEMLGASSVADAVLYAVTRPAEMNVDELRLSRS